MSGAQENPILPAAKSHAGERPPLQYLGKASQQYVFPDLPRSRAYPLPQAAGVCFLLYYSGFALPASIPFAPDCIKKREKCQKIYAKHISFYICQAPFHMALLPAIPFLPQIRSCIQCRFVLYYGMYTKQNLKEGVRRGDYTGKLRRKAADSQRLCPSVSGRQSRAGQNESKSHTSAEQRKSQKNHQKRWNDCLGIYIPCASVQRI